MCGRYTAKKNAVDLAAEFDAADHTGDEEVREDYNVAPTKRVVVVRAARPPQDAPAPAAPARELAVMRWGLVPFWAKDVKIGNRTFNARAEKVTSTPAFRSAVKRRRCLVPADGWYEWKRDPETKLKQAYYMTRGDGHDLAFAGLWEIWGEGDDRLTTFTVLTTDAVGQLADVHHRMPFVLPADRYDAWLDPSRSDVTDLLGDGPALDLVESLELRPVSDRVNKVQNNGPDLTDRIEHAAVPLHAGA